MIKKIIKLTVKIFILLTIITLALEAAVRFYLFGFDSFNYFKMNSFRPVATSGMLRASSVPGIVYELKPGLDMYHKMARFRTNSRGLRDKEYTVNKPKNTFRVAVVGDSFTMATGVNIEDTFHSVLEERLNAEFPERSHEFINFGVAGYDPTQYLSVLRHKALEYDPDLALFCLFGPLDNGFYPEKVFREPYKVKPLSNPFFESFFLKLARRNLILNYIKGRLKKIIYGDRIAEDDREEVLKRRGEKLEEVFSELGEFSRTHDIPVCVVILLHVYRDLEQGRQTERLAAKYGLHFIDTTPAFKGTRLSEFTVYKIDDHPNAKAHEIFAEVIYDYLKEQKLL